MTPFHMCGVRSVEGFFKVKTLFVPNVNFTTEQFTDRETGLHRISLMLVIYILKGAITKISTGPHSRKMTTIYLLRLMGLLINTATPPVLLLLIRLFGFQHFHFGLKSAGLQGNTQKS